MSAPDVVGVYRSPSNGQFMVQAFEALFHGTAGFRATQYFRLLPAEASPGDLGKEVIAARRWCDGSWPLTDTPPNHGSLDHVLRFNAAWHYVDVTFDQTIELKPFRNNIGRDEHEVHLPLDACPIDLGEQVFRLFAYCAEPVV